ncbi:MAG: hypothetical protein MZW92_41055 [Comamonadaceae bacterium]|nr:hypothetical protein [Comamonadaceae bacterium]
MRRLFSLSGNHIMPVYDALLGSDDRDSIHTRHEGRGGAHGRRVGTADRRGRRRAGHRRAGPRQRGVGALHRADGRVAGGPAVGPCAARRNSASGAFQEMRQADMARAGRPRPRGPAPAPTHWAPTSRARCASPASGGPARCT